MFQAFKRRVSDMATIRDLCLKAEAYAHKDGQREPGAEHFLLGAFDLPDGAARRAFARVGAVPEQLQGAIADQYASALRAIGVTGELDPEPDIAGPAHGPYQAAPSGREVMQKLVARPRIGGSTTLNGADVVAVVATLQRGVSARALRAMNVDLEALRQAAVEESVTSRSGAEQN